MKHWSKFILCLWMYCSLNVTLYAVLLITWFMASLCVNYYIVVYIGTIAL